MKNRLLAAGAKKVEKTSDKHSFLVQLEFDKPISSEGAYNYLMLMLGDGLHKDFKIEE